MSFPRAIRVLGIGEGAAELEKALSREREPSFEVVEFAKAPRAEETALFDAAFIDADRLTDWRRSGGRIPAIVYCSDPKTAAQALRDGAADAVLPGDLEARILRRVIQGAVARREREGQTVRTAGMGLDFLLFVAHEIRGPLAIVKEGVTLVGDKILGKINPKQEKVLQTAKRNIDRIDHLIAGMLDIAKLESGRMELRGGLFDFMALVKEAAEPYALLAAEKKIEFKARASGPIRVSADRARLKEVLDILLSNALKFTESGSVSLEAASAKGELIVTVKDTGVGIEKEDLSRIFQKFSQLGWAPGGGHKGMGIGLAVARGIIGLHGGVIEVESAPGKGSAFTFRIPVEPRRGSRP